MSSKPEDNDKVKTPKNAKKLKKSDKIKTVHHIKKNI